MNVLTLSDPWARYVPDARVPWNMRRVVHLHRRAAFGATWEEMQRDLKDGPDVSVYRVLIGPTRSYETFTGITPTSRALGDAAVAAQEPDRLKAWWVYRMLFGPHPLMERLTLMWHNHFATSNLKVNDLAAMRRQNEVFRQGATVSFGLLVDFVLRDPAMLLWLDAPSNRKRHPNENLARELMELFTLGIGQYTETDVKEAARALTGWTVEDGKTVELPAQHDDGVKTILGHSGRWDVRHLKRILLEHPATARRLAARLCGLFFGEGVLDAAAVQFLADGLRQHELAVGWAVRTILRSRAFFADANIGSRVPEPVAALVGPVRALEMLDPSPSTLAIADWAARQGQDLFYPPNVGGWPGGRSWVTTRAIVSRANYAVALVEGKVLGRPQPYDAFALARRHGRGKDLDDLIAFHTELLTGTPQTAAWRARIRTGIEPKVRGEEARARRAVALILASPEMLLA